MGQLEEKVQKIRVEICDVAEMLDPSDQTGRKGRTGIKEAEKIYVLTMDLELQPLDDMF